MKKEDEEIKYETGIIPIKSFIRSDNFMKIVIKYKTEIKIIECSANTDT